MHAHLASPVCVQWDNVALPLPLLLLLLLLWLLLLLLPLL